MSSFKKSDRDAYHQRVGEEEAARRRSENLDDLIADFERVNGPADADAVADKRSRLGAGTSDVIPDMTIRSKGR